MGLSRRIYIIYPYLRYISVYMVRTRHRLSFNRARYDTYVSGPYTLIQVVEQEQNIHTATDQECISHGPWIKGGTEITAACYTSIVTLLSLGRELLLRGLPPPSPSGGATQGAAAFWASMTAPGAERKLQWRFAAPC